jgi:hypothetical protein
LDDKTKYSISHELRVWNEVVGKAGSAIVDWSFPSTGKYRLEVTIKSYAFLTSKEIFDYLLTSMKVLPSNFKAEHIFVNRMFTDDCKQFLKKEYENLKLALDRFSIYTS